MLDGITEHTMGAVIEVPPHTEAGLLDHVERIAMLHLRIDYTFHCWPDK